MQDISQDIPSFLTASDLFLRRGINCKNKSKDEGLELHKGPKLYYPNDCATAGERIEDFLLETKNDLELQRTAKIRDCMKAEWNEELKVAIVPYLKGKTTQHMGMTLNGKCALSPEEAIFLLEKGYIEIVHNNVSLSVEEAYSLMFRGKLSIEKYEVYSFLSQQGFIVVRHQFGVNPNAEKTVNLSNTMKRKAADESIALPERKRLTFTGVLASNAVSTQSTSIVSDSVLNKSDSFNKAQCAIENTLSSEQNVNNSLEEVNSKLNSEESEDATISPDSTYLIDLNDSTQKEANGSCVEMQCKNNLEIKNNDLVCSKDIEIATVNKDSNEPKCKNDSNGEVFIEKAKINSDEVVVENPNDNSEIVVEHVNEVNEIDIELDYETNEIDAEATHKNNEIDVVAHKNNEIIVEDADKNNDIDVEAADKSNEIDIQLTHDDNEIDVVNANDDIEINANDNNEIRVEFDNNGDSNEIIIEVEQRVDEMCDIDVGGSLKNYHDECLSSDDSIPVVCDESNEISVDVFSYSLGGNQPISNSKTGLHDRPSNEHDDEVTLVEVKKKETKPLAVIDLLSDEDSDCERNRNDLDEEHEGRTNGGEMYEDSDDEIQVLDVVSPTPTGHAQGTSRTSNSVKIESKKLKISEDSSTVKPPYAPTMKFPVAFRKDIICIPRPPNHLLPLHVQPAKEAYVLNSRKSSETKQSRVWNSYRDMQDYQRERRFERHMNSFNNRSGPFRDQNNSFGNQLPSFSTSENPRGDAFNRNIPSFSSKMNRNFPGNARDDGFNRNVQNHSFQQNRNLSGDEGFNRNIQSYSYQQNRNVSISKPFINHERSSSLLSTPNAYSPQNNLPFSMNMNVNHLQNLSSSNPVAFVNELQKTVYSLTTNMISTMFGHHLNQNAPSPAQSPAFGEPSMMGFPLHSNNNFAISPGIPGPVVYNSSSRSDFPLRFPLEPAFSGNRYSYPGNSSYMSENNWRQSYFRQRNFAQRGQLFPCKYRTVRKRRDWREVKASVDGMNDSGSDIEEVPINLNQFLWGTDIHPFIKPGSKLQVADVLKSLRITQMANLCDTKRCNERYLPTTPCLEISFDVYLPNSKYKRSEPTTPKYRIIVIRSTDPIPRYSELVYLQRKLDDRATLQVAVVDHSDISFYSFNSFSVPEIVPFEN